MTFESITGPRRRTLVEVAGHDADELRVNVDHSTHTVSAVLRFRGGHEVDAEPYLRLLEGTGERACTAPASVCTRPR